jgi:hypothetical protein
MLKFLTIFSSEQGFLELLPSGRLLERNVPTLALRRINGDSAGNYHASWTKNPPKE